MKNILFFSLCWLLIPLLAFAQWSNNPAVNNPINTMGGEQAIPKIATCPNGDSYIGFFSNEMGNYNVRLQRLDAQGNALWAVNGILVSSHPQMTWLTDWDMVADNDNHAILAFQDIRNGGNNNVVAYRISPSGSFVWGANGIALSNSTAFDVSPKICVTAAGNAVFAWQADDIIIMKKLSPAGNLLWGENGIILSGSATFSWPQLLAVGTDDVIVKYFQDTGPPYSPTRHVYAQRYNSAGNPVWFGPTVISNAGGITAWTQIFPFINDGNDGFFIAWHDDRDFNNLASAFVHHISSNGTPLFPANGIEVSTLGNRHHFYPQLAIDPGSSDICVFWNEMDADQNLRGIYGQKINSFGSLMWGSSGKVFIEISYNNVYPIAARSTPVDMVLFYEDYFNATTGQLKAMRVKANGEYVWTPSFKTISSVNSSKVHVDVNEFANHQWILAWEDDRSGAADIYAQNILLSGNLGIMELTYLVCQAVDDLNQFLNGVYVEVNGPEGTYSGTITNDSLVFVDLPYGMYNGYAVIEGWEPVPAEIELDGENHHMIFYFTTTGLTDRASAGQDMLRLWPNPFQASVTIDYQLEKASRITAEIRSMGGTAVDVIVDEWQLAGTHRIEWQGTGPNGQQVPPGAYIFIIRTAKQVYSKVLIRN